MYVRASLKIQVFDLFCRHNVTGVALVCYTMICWSCTICDSNLRSEIGSFYASIYLFLFFVLFTDVTGVGSERGDRSRRFGGESELS